MPVTGPELTPPQQAALRALAAACDAPHGTAALPWGHASARQVARLMWPESPAWTKRTHRRGASGGAGAVGGTMPMKAAAVLWRLHAAGLVDEDDRRWSLTAAGRRALESLGAPGGPGAAG